KQTTMKPKTRSENKRILGYFLTYCTQQGVALEDIKPRTVATYLEYLQATHCGKINHQISSHTLYLHVSLIKAFLNWCALDEEFEKYVSMAMVVRIEKPKQTVFTRDIFT